MSGRWSTAWQREDGNAHHTAGWLHSASTLDRRLSRMSLSDGLDGFAWDGRGCRLEEEDMEGVDKSRVMGEERR